MAKKTITYSLFLMILALVSCQTKKIEVKEIDNKNLERSIELLNKTLTDYFTGEDMSMARYFNPYTDSVSEERGSVWMYTSSIEAVNAVLKGLQSAKEMGDSILYKEYFRHYTDILSKLYNGLDYYKGTYTLTSYTQTKEWTVYGVNRSNIKDEAKVSGIENVYDDQMWLMRELIEAYEVTNNEVYLDKAEYLASYILDGWDATINNEGTENGGITWGPGYVTKHACSNGPAISPLVWLAEIYKNRATIVSDNYIDPQDKKTRKSRDLKKTDYYISYAKKIYDWQMRTLIMPEGVFFDMQGGCDPNCDVVYETIDGIKYRTNTKLTDVSGKAHTYNTGSMISGAVDLYKFTKEERYLSEAKKMADDSFTFFAKKNTENPSLYTYPVDGFSNWFNGVLLRSYIELYPFYNKVDLYINSFQSNLNYGYDNYLYKGLLPTNLLEGWDKDEKDNQTEGMFMFTFAAEYALLSDYKNTLSNNK